MYIEHIYDNAEGIVANNSMHLVQSFVVEPYIPGEIVNCQFKDMAFTP